MVDFDIEVRTASVCLLPRLCCSLYESNSYYLFKRNKDRHRGADIQRQQDNIEVSECPKQKIISYEGKLRRQTTIHPTK